jgi:hypothetical protein
METIVKYNVKAIKDQIHIEALIQKALKNQRKTVNLKGERLMEPSEATWRSLLQGQKLRILYAAYGLMRGKSFEQTERRSDTTTEHPLSVRYKNAIDNCLSVFEIKETVES